MPNKDYYDILGVDKSTTQDEIKKAFRKKAHEYHPDKKTGDEAKFKEINEAYQTIGNEQKRKQYDQFGSAFNGQSGFNGGGNHGGFSGNWQDFARAAGDQGGFKTNVNFDGINLEDIMGDFFGHGSKSSGATQNRGADLQYEMEIDLAESCFGIEKIINIEKMDICDNCNGKGYDSNAKIITCPECNGAGQVNKTQRTIFGAFQSRSICPTCEGSGKKPDKFCNQCHGSGKHKKTKQLKIKIPAGINNDESIRLSNEGEAGAKNSSSGDLYITFFIKPNNKFTRNNYDILSKQEINIVQATMGDKIEIETIDGLVRLKIPAGTTSGKIFKLASKGSHKLHGKGRGDHLVEIIVKTPTKLSRKAKKLFAELRSEL